MSRTSSWIRQIGNLFAQFVPLVNGETSYDPIGVLLVNGQEVNEVQLSDGNRDIVFWVSSEYKNCVVVNRDELAKAENEPGRFVHFCKDVTGERVTFRFLTDLSFEKMYSLSSQLYDYD